MSQALKRCPGCGNEARQAQFDEDSHMWIVYCKTWLCGFSAFHGSKEKAEQQWNTRTPSPATKAMLQIAMDVVQSDTGLLVSAKELQAFINEWKEQKV